MNPRRQGDYVFLPRGDPDQEAILDRQFERVDALVWDITKRKKGLRDVEGEEVVLGDEFRDPDEESTIEELREFRPIEDAGDLESLPDE